MVTITQRKQATKVWEYIHPGTSWGLRMELDRRKVLALRLLLARLREPRLFGSPLRAQILLEPGLALVLEPGLALVLVLVLVRPWAWYLMNQLGERPCIS